MKLWVSQEYDQAQPEASRAAGKDFGQEKIMENSQDPTSSHCHSSQIQSPTFDKRMYTQAAKAMEAMNKAYDEETGGTFGK